ncbi:MAG: DUF2807 domain-containing protein [Chitinophagaceae bacterium]|nr:DUF2807 domain-containing protein [Chitinophagaceae bacterium]
MKKFFPVFFVFAICFSLIVSCSKEPTDPIDRSFSNAGFTKIDAGDQHRITITRGTSFSIVARGEERDINDLLVQNSGDLLKIEYNRYKPNRKRVNLTITMPSLEGVMLAGQSQATISGFSETVPVTLNVSGQAACWINVNAPKFFAQASGQSKIEFLGGSSTGLESNASGQSEILAYGLMPVITATAIATGQSTIKLKVGNSLNADASGQSRIYYQGNPPIKNIIQTGSARIIQE